MHIRLILKYYPDKSDRWKWEHRHYDDMYSEIYDELHKQNPNQLHQNIRSALKRTSKILPRRGTYSYKHKNYLSVKLYALSPNHTTFKKETTHETPRI